MATGRRVRRVSSQSESGASSKAEEGATEDNTKQAESATGRANGLGGASVPAPRGHGLAAAQAARAQRTAAAHLADARSRAAHGGRGGRRHRAAPQAASRSRRGLLLQRGTACSCICGRLPGRQRHPRDAAAAAQGGRLAGAAAQGGPGRKAAAGVRCGARCGGGWRGAWAGDAAAAGGLRKRSQRAMAHLLT